MDLHAGWLEREIVSASYPFISAAQPKETDRKKHLVHGCFFVNKLITFLGSKDSHGTAGLQTVWFLRERDHSLSRSNGCLFALTCYVNWFGWSDGRVRRHLQSLGIDFHICTNTWPCALQQSSTSERCMYSHITYRRTHCIHAHMVMLAFKSPTLHLQWFHTLFVLPLFNSSCVCFLTHRRQHREQTCKIIKSLISYLNIPFIHYQCLPISSQSHFEWLMRPYWPA